MNFNVTSPLPRPCSGLEEDSGAEFNSLTLETGQTQLAAATRAFVYETRQGGCSFLEAFPHADPSAWNVLCGQNILPRPPPDTPNTTSYTYTAQMSASQKHLLSSPFYFSLSHNLHYIYYHYNLLFACVLLIPPEANGKLHASGIRRVLQIIPRAGAREAYKYLSGLFN